MRETTSGMLERKLRLYEEYSLYAKLIDKKDFKEEKKTIVKSMEKLIFEIVDLTTDEYNARYNSIFNREANDVNEELTKLEELVAVIEKRKNYIEKMIEEYKTATRLPLERDAILGDKEINAFKTKIKLIHRYKDNILDIQRLNNKNNEIDGEIFTYEQILDKYERNNRNAEEKLNSELTNSFKNLGVFDYRPKEILDNFERANELLKLKEGNLILAKEMNAQSDIRKCEEELQEARSFFEEYYIKNNLLNLLEISQEIVHSYDEYLSKRNKIKDILDQLMGHQIYNDINALLEFQINDFKSQKVDLDGYEKAKKQRVKNLEKINELEEDNSKDDIKSLVESYHDAIIPAETFVNDENLNIPIIASAINETNSEEQKVEITKDKEPKKEQLEETKEIKEDEVNKETPIETHLPKVDNLQVIIRKTIASPELQKAIIDNRAKFQEWFYRVSVKLNPTAHIPQSNLATKGGDN